MSFFRVLTTGSRRGRRLVADLDGRARRSMDPKVQSSVAATIAAVRSGGDRALLREVRRHDRVRADSLDELLWDGKAPTGELTGGFANALERAITAIERYHRQQVQRGFELVLDGIELHERRDPLRRVGIYVPGGRASYPSTVLMTAIPARIAGVREIVVVTPPAALRSSPALALTLQTMELSEVWGVGGAHAIAALAYGTESIERVDKIVGPGNVWVTAAKQLVSGDVAIDGLAGPTEVVIVASTGAEPGLVAADLLAQAEHDPRAVAILITADRELALETRRELKRQLPSLSSREVAKRSLESSGCALIVEDYDEALELINRIAPEHLQLIGDRAEALTARRPIAGAVFVGAESAEVFGDYLAGPSHVLPTSGTARFASPLGVDDFVRRSHVVRFNKAAASRNAAAAAIFAEVEGFPAHAAAARRRLEKR